MRPSSENIDPPLWSTVILGFLLAVLWSAAYVIQPAYIEHLQLKIGDAIVADAPPIGHSDTVLVVDIDEHSLQTWGQWPWPRSRLAILLATLNELGARSIALDFILAEPDRTALKPEAPRSSTTGRLPGQAPAAANAPTESDAILAATLAAGPYVLGYEFQFSAAEKASRHCRLHALKGISGRPSASGDGSPDWYEASGVVCNLELFSRRASHSGFLNGTPDADGRLRRLPLAIRYHEQAYPSLALATLLCTQASTDAVLTRHTAGGYRLKVGRYVIPMDDRGNLRISYPVGHADLRQVTADDVLTGRVDGEQIKGRVVLVGLSASGLTPMFMIPDGRFVSPVEIHARALETVLSGNYIQRRKPFVIFEVFFSLLVAVLFNICLARLEAIPAAAIGGTGMAAIWIAAQACFDSQRLLFSPLLPTAVILTNGILLMLFKYWIRQRNAHRRMQDALILMKSSEANLNAIIKTIPDIVFRLDPFGRITFISPALARYNRQPEELIGSHILDLVDAQDKDRARFRINERRTGKRATTDLEIRLCLQPGALQAADGGRYFNVSAEGIYASMPPTTKEFRGTQGIARDIDARKHIERKLERSQKMEAIGGLAAGVAHDLNNILSGLVSYPELLLLDLPADSPFRTSIETIQRSGQRAADIVQDLLMIARRGIKDHDCINLNSVIRTYLQTPEFDRLRKNHVNTRFDSELADDLMNIRGSALHLSKLIMNLLSNAVEAMPAGGVIRIRTANCYLDTEMDGYERIPEGEYVILSVADEGIGIPAGDLQRIFEPFYSKKQMGRSGSGLGMTVIWNTVKDHTGYVDVRSREGDGTRFDIYLPATREQKGKIRSRFVLQDYIGTERVLIVDDIAEQLDIAVKMLGKLGYRVAAASGGEAAINYLRHSHADLVVLDMVMPPGIDGLETYRRILEFRSDQKVIIASGYAASDRVKRMQAMGAGEYIRKPYTLEKIGLAVRRELDRQK